MLASFYTKPESLFLIFVKQNIVILQFVMRTMKNFIIIILVICMGCKKSENAPSANPTQTNPEDAFADNYKFYPLKNAYQWNYTHYEINPFPGDTTKRELVQYHNESTMQTTTLFNSDTFSYNWFRNRNNKLKTGSFILLDYALLKDCQGDSVLIFQDTTSNGTRRQRFQYCGFRNVNTPIPQYANLNCVKSILYNTFSDGRKYVQEVYFSKNLGVVADISYNYSNTGVLLTKRMQFLTSTNF